MEFISKLLSVIAFAVILAVIVTSVIYFILRIYIYFAERKIKKQKRELALLSLNNLKDSYDLLMICRTQYHKAKYIENLEEKVAKQEEIRAIYKEQVQRLSNPDYVVYRECLTEKELEELEEVLSRPRYELI